MSEGSELMREYLEGHSKNFGQISRKISAVYGLQIADAMDVVQQAFCQTIKYAENYDPAAGSPSAYFHRVLDSQANEFFRGKPREKNEGSFYDEDGETFSEPFYMETSPGVLDGIVQREAVSCFIGILKNDHRIALRSRQILLLKAQGFRNSEISEYMGLDPGSVKQKLRDAKVKFRDKYSRVFMNP